jgi:hypothetical protein
MNNDPGLVAAFCVGAVLSNLLLVQYGWKSRWRATPTGWVLLSLFGVFALSYNLSVAFLLWPHLFDGGIGAGIRVGARWIINAVLLALYLLLHRAQYNDRAGRGRSAISQEGIVRQRQPKGSTPT